MDALLWRFTGLINTCELAYVFASRNDTNSLERFNNSHCIIDKCRELLNILHYLSNIHNSGVSEIYNDYIKKCHYLLENVKSANKNIYAGLPIKIKTRKVLPLSELNKSTIRDSHYLNNFYIEWVMYEHNKKILYGNNTGKKCIDKIHVSGIDNAHNNCTNFVNDINDKCYDDEIGNWADYMERYY